MVRTVAVVAVLACLAPPPARADDAPRTWTDLDIRITPLVTIRNHGYFRFRFNELYRLDLGAGGASGFAAPIDSNPVNQALGRSRAGVETANMRLRWEPELVVGEWLTVHATIDFLDNLVLGETPDFGKPGTPTAFFARSMNSPSDGLNGFRDAVRVKAAWADLRVFERVHLIGGRVPEKFGLGIMRNDGSAPDSDFGDWADGIYGRVKLATAYFRIGMEFPGEGATTESPRRFFGPVYDSDQHDDIMRWVFVFDSTPREPDELEERRHRLDVDRLPAIDWAMYHALSTQDLSSDRGGGPTPTFCGTGVKSPYGQPFDCYTLTVRDAFFWTPALWARFLYHPTPDLSIRLEAEVAMVYGHIGMTQAFHEDSKIDTRKTFFEVGGAFEGEVDYGANSFGLLFGAASGDAASGGRFGVLDGQTVSQTSDADFYDELRRDRVVAGNGSVRNFTFNRDYRVDSILFREVIGAVTNAFYVKPTYHRELVRSGIHTFGAGVSLMAAFAAVPEGTPGNARGLGVEAGLKLDYHLGRHLSVVADGAVLFPLDGLRDPSSTEDPKPAMALRTMLMVGF